MTEGVLGGLLALLGEGGPFRGDVLDSSGSMFDGVSTQIAALGPDGGWQGSAARAYGARNLAQSQHTILMADLDRLAAELVSAQAEHVKFARDFMRIEIGIVSVVLVVCIGLESRGPDGQEVSFYIASFVAAIVLLIAGVVMYDLAEKTWLSASDMQAVAQRLTAMVAGLPSGLDAVAGPPKIALPPTHSRSEFDLADSSAAFPLIPDLGSAFTDLPGAPEFHLATGAGAGLPDFGAPQLPITALTGLPALPTLAQLSTTLSQLTNLAGPTSATTQPAQQHTTPADHRTRDDDTNTPDTDAATAGTTSSGERAPLGSTTQPTQQHQKLVV